MENNMAVTPTANAGQVPPMMTVALLPGKPETKMRLVDIQKKERQEQKEQGKKIDAPEKQPQSSTVVNISAKARDLNRLEPVNQTYSAAKTSNSTDQAANISAKDKEVNSAAPTPQSSSAVAQPPSAVNPGSSDIPSKKG